MQGVVLKNRGEEGIAMMLALAAVFLLSVAVLATRAGVDLASEIAVSSARETQAGYLARSGLALVSAALADDGPAVDSFDDDWAAANEMGAIPIADVGWAVGKVTDEEGKFNILDLINNDEDSAPVTADRLFSLLNYLGLDESRANEVVDSLIDWMDENSNVTGLGAENSYYKSLVPGYNCPNGPALTVDELALVKGIGPVLLYQGEGDVPPLADYITVYGDGKVNINTAPLEVLMALVVDDGTSESGEVMDRERAEEIVAVREENPFLTSSEIKVRAGISNDLFNDLATLIDVKSSHFSARITGETQAASSQAYGVFKRTGNSVKLVYYKGF